MSKDIRSFFQIVSQKKGTDSTNRPSKTPETKRKKAKVLIDSDDENDIIKSTPEQSKQPKKSSKHALSSDSEDDIKKIKTSNKSPMKKMKSKESPTKLKLINIEEKFKDVPIKQSKVVPIPKIEDKIIEQKVKTSKKRKNKSGLKETDVHSDEDFQKTLLDLDDDLLLDNVDMLDKTIDEALHNTGSSKENSPKAKKTEVAKSTELKDTPKKRVRKLSVDKGETPSKRKKLEHVDSGIDPDQEAFEKKRYSAMLYEKYKNRGGPKNHGSKELPKGKPDCLKNITFLRTGVLDSLEGHEFENLIKEHGGRVVHAVSKKVNYLVVGDDAGPAKLEKARNYNIPSIDEDEFLDLILKKSDMKPKYSKKDPENGSEDHGIDVENFEDDESKFEIKKSKSPRDISKKKEVLKKENRRDISTLPKPKTQDRKPSTSTKSEDLPAFERPLIVVNESNKCWAEKYKPTEVRSVIGQQDDKSNLNKLKVWLMKWDYYRQPEIFKKLIRPSPWNTSQDGSYFKCALLSGPPGVGKTTTATLVCRELGYDIVEFNASDTRSKKLLQSEVGQLLSTNTIAGFAGGKKTTDKKRVLLMDEVDGMAGNEDRGGIQEFINLIKNTSIPIICMCNDRNHQKMRSLLNHCFELKFVKPRVEQIRGAMMSICFKENLQISANALTEIITGTGCDIRQTLNHLSMWSAANKTITKETAEKESKIAQKDTILGPWEVVRTVFTESENKNMSIIDKSRLFFYDYSIGPLFVQENYLKVQPNCDKKEVLERIALTADSFSRADIIDSKMRSSNNWSLLESQAIYSTVLPSHYMSGFIKERIAFPSWLGKNSSKNKMKRILSELQVHTRISTSGSKLAMKLDYLVPLCNAIINPLRLHGTAGIPKSVGIMKEYNLLREDLDNIVELCKLSGSKNAFSEIDSKVKSAFTRAYNKEAPLLPYSTASGVSKKRAALQDDLLEEEEYIESDNEDKDDIKTDGMIKVKEKTAAKAKKATGKADASSDSKKGKGKGKKTSK